MTYLSKSVVETNKIAGDFLNSLGRPQSNEALVVGLFGDLGSGKTTFTQALGKLLGVSEVMTSPTFVIEKIYLLKNHSEEIPVVFKRLIHIDAYRLEKGKELQSLGFAEILKDPKNLILIEWPERVVDILPPDLIKINFKFVSEFEREISF
jgi:tRNA threonylcarbamoyladenosine biosynthesis protein TsaE